MSRIPQMLLNELGLFDVWNNGHSHICSLMCNIFYLPVQFLPSPWNPLRQRQTYDPLVLVHSALGSHWFASEFAHSSMSMIIKVLLLSESILGHRTRVSKIKVRSVSDLMQCKRNAKQTWAVFPISLISILTAAAIWSFAVGANRIWVTLIRLGSCTFVDICVGFQLLRIKD